MTNSVGGAAPRICIYCASSSDIDPEFRAGAVALGREVAKRGWTVVYGAGSVGLMGDVATGAFEENGHVIGVIPDFMKSRELDHPDLEELYVVPDMHRRKQMMIDLADAFVALPGGTGTLEELSECISFRRLGLHHGRIVVADWKNFYRPLLEMLEVYRTEGFMPMDEAVCWEVAGDLEGVLGILDEEFGGDSAAS